MKILEGVEKIGLYGLGRSNLALAKYIRSRGIRADIILRTDKAISLEDFGLLHPDAVMVGDMAKKHYSENVLFLSPSVNPERLSVPTGVRITTDTELFFEEKARRAIGITGSDGKSTTTHLVTEILNASGIAAESLGNCGNPFADAMDTQRLAVCELSSFQLTHFAPPLYRAVITNISENHLDWHGTMDEYVRAKLKILSRAEGFVFDADSVPLLNATRGLRAFCAVSRLYSYSELKALVDAENYLTEKDLTVFLDGKELISIDGAKRKEPYNIKNYMLAIAATLGIADIQAVLKTIVDFKGLKHRCELLFSDGKISYIDSSVDSSPERSATTLSSLSGRVVAIVGGRGKGLSIEPLYRVIKGKCIGAVAMGEVGSELLRKARADGNIRITKASDMDEAIEKAKNMLSGEGTVILSPAATSFDKYKNFEERAEDFLRALRLSIKEI